MHAIRLHAFGPAENLVSEELPDPTPAPDQVRIAVEASGVHLVDTTIRAGEAGGPFPLPELPTIPGREVAGTVVEGPDVWVGRRVVAHLGRAPGGYASQAVVPTKSLHVLADDADAAAAVAMIGTGRTATAILEVAALTADDTVLVLAAAGGLGALLVQAGRNAGARVIGAAGGPDKVALVRELGADVAYDYTAAGWTDALDGVTVLLDGVGGALARAALERMAPSSRVVVFGWSGGDPVPAEQLAARGIAAAPALGPRILDRPGGIRALETASLEALASGALRPLVTTFPLARAADAHRALEERRTTGKVVLVP